jgi:hypothetical protein
MRNNIPIFSNIENCWYPIKNKIYRKHSLKHSIFLGPGTISRSMFINDFHVYASKGNIREAFTREISRLFYSNKSRT